MNGVLHLTRDIDQAVVVRDAATGEVVLRIVVADVNHRRQVRLSFHGPGMRVDREEAVGRYDRRQERRR